MMKNFMQKKIYFDQILCTEAQKYYIDCVILKFMTDKNRVVSEVLDTRNKTSSYQHI
jgi:hypothetical protein